MVNIQFKLAQALPYTFATSTLKVCPLGFRTSIARPALGCNTDFCDQRRSAASPIQLPVSHRTPE